MIHKNRFNGRIPQTGPILTQLFVVLLKIIASTLRLYFPFELKMLYYNYLFHIIYK